MASWHESEAPVFPRALDEIQRSPFNSPIKERRRCPLLYGYGSGRIGKAVQICRGPATVNG